MKSLSYLWGKFVQLYLTPKIINNCNINRFAKVCSGSILNNVYMDKYSYIGHHCSINDCKIGKMCSIAGECSIGGSAHPIEWVSTSPIFHSERNVIGKHFGHNHFVLRQETIIENDVWIGARVIIKSGVNIGNGAIIGMGSVVTKDIPPYEVWAGNPARFIKKRFNDDIIRDLLDIQWWNFDDERLIEYSNVINNPNAFIKKYKSLNS